MTALVPPTCKHHGLVKVRKDYPSKSVWVCRKCHSHRTQAWRDRRADRDPAIIAAERERQWAYEIRKKFNISAAEYRALSEAQGHVCALCRRPEREVRNQRSPRLAIDHDHACCDGDFSCGRCIRGLLCGTCNKGLGQLGDNEEGLLRALAYIRRSSVRVRCAA